MEPWWPMFPGGRSALPHFPAQLVAPSPSPTCAAGQAVVGRPCPAPQAGRGVTATATAWLPVPPALSGAAAHQRLGCPQEPGGTPSPSTAITAPGRPRGQDAAPCPVWSRRVISTADSARLPPARPPARTAMATALATVATTAPTAATTAPSGTCCPAAPTADSCPAAPGQGRARRREEEPGGSRAPGQPWPLAVSRDALAPPGSWHHSLSRKKTNRGEAWD